MMDDNREDAQEHEPQSFGVYLRNARLEQGITLEQVCHHTKINFNQLLAIEQEAHDYLPAEVYVTGFLKMYAQAVGGDAERAVRLYRQELRARQMAARAEFNKGGRRVKLWLTLWAIILILGGAAAVAYLYRPELMQLLGIHHPDRPHAEQESAGPLQTEAQTDADALPAVGGSAAQEAAASPGHPPQGTAHAAVDGAPKEARGAFNPKGGQALANQGASPKEMTHRYLLKVSAHEDGWIKVIIDGQKPEEFQLKAGDHLELPADSGYNILLGNAAGVDLFLNNRPVPVLGKSGQIVTLQVP